MQYNTKQAGGNYKANHQLGIYNFVFNKHSKIKIIVYIY